MGLYYQTVESDVPTRHTIKKVMPNKYMSIPQEVAETTMKTAEIHMKYWCPSIERVKTY